MLYPIKEVNPTIEEIREQAYKEGYKKGYATGWYDCTEKLNRENAWTRRVPVVDRQGGGFDEGDMPVWR